MTQPQDSTQTVTPESVLLVDDDPDLLKLLRLLLEADGCLVSAADCAQDALRLAESWQYDMVLTDHWMPEMHGVDLVRALVQRWPRYRGRCVLFSCAVIPEAAAQQLHALGGRTVLLPELGMDGRPDRVRSLLELARKRHPEAPSAGSDGV